MDFKRNGNMEETPFIGKIKVPEDKIKKFLAIEEKGIDACARFADIFDDEIGNTAKAMNDWINAQDGGQAQTIALVTLFYAVGQLEAGKMESGKTASAKVIASIVEVKQQALRAFMMKDSPLGALADLFKGINRGGGC